jgi:hypothetical protein
MRVTVKVSGHIAAYFPASEFTVCPEGSPDVAALVAGLGLDPGLVMAVLVGGRRRPVSYVPQDGDELVLLAPPGGG